MNDLLNRRSDDGRLCLLSRPQRLGILPTWQFWKGDNWRLVRWPAAIVVFVAIVLASAIQWWGAPLYVAGLVAVLLPGLAVTVTLGLFERHVRRRALLQRDRLDTKAGCGARESES